MKNILQNQVDGGMQMKRWNTENEARDEIKELVADFYHEFKEPKETKENFKPGNRVSYASRVYDEKEMQSLTDAMLDFWLTTGRFADEFEKKFAEWIGVKYAHLVNSGSSANLIAFSVLTAEELGDRQIRRGDEVITVAAGFPTTITPAIQYGAVPVFVDVTIPQYNIDVTKLEEALSDKTKAVMIAHTLGNPFDLTAFDNNSKENINFMYSAGTNFEEEDLDEDGYYTTNDEVSGDMFNMVLPGVGAGSYDIVLECEVLEFDEDSEAHFEARDIGTDESIATVDIKEGNTNVELKNVTLDDTTNVLLKVDQTTNTSIKLKKVKITKL